MCRAQGFSPEAVPSKLARKKDGGRTGQLDSSEFGVERMTTNCRARIDDVQLGDALKGRVTGVAERLWLCGLRRVEAEAQSRSRLSRSSLCFQEGNKTAERLQDCSEEAIGRGQSQARCWSDYSLKRPSVADRSQSGTSH